MKSSTESFCNLLSGLYCIENKSLLYSIVIKACRIALQTAFGRKLFLFSRVVYFGVPRPGTYISCDRFPHDHVLNDMLPTDKGNLILKLLP